MQCKELYSLADTVVELIFVFLRVTFPGSPFFRSSIVITKDTDSVDSTRPIHCNTSERRVGSATAPTPFIRSPPVISKVPCTSATCLLCVSTSVDLPFTSPSLCYSPTHAHRFIVTEADTTKALSDSLVHGMMTEVDNWDLRVHHREATCVKNRRNVEVGSLDNQPPPHTDKDGFLYHTGLGLVEWILYWCFGDFALLGTLL